VPIPCPTCAQEIFENLRKRGILNTALRAYQRKVSSLSEIDDYCTSTPLRPFELEVNERLLRVSKTEYCVNYQNSSSLYFVFLNSAHQIKTSVARSPIRGKIFRSENGIPNPGMNSVHSFFFLALIQQISQ
jgi:hypothetical protein